MAYYDPRKLKPWPIRLLNKLGVTNDATALGIAISFAVIAIIVTINFYIQIFNSNEPQSDDLDPWLLNEMMRGASG